MNIFFVASSTFEKMTEVVSGLWPFIAISFITMIIVTYVPWFSLAIPNALFK